MDINEIMRAVAQQAMENQELAEAHEANTPETWTVFMARKIMRGVWEYFQRNAETAALLFSAPDGASAIAVSAGQDTGAVTMKLVHANEAEALRSNGKTDQDIFNTLTPLPGTRVLVFSVSVQ